MELNYKKRMLATGAHDEIWLEVCFDRVSDEHTIYLRQDPERTFDSVLRFQFVQIATSLVIEAVSRGLTTSSADLQFVLTSPAKQRKSVRLEAKQELIELKPNVTGGGLDVKYWNTVSGA